MRPWLTSDDRQGILEKPLSTILLSGYKMFDFTRLDDFLPRRNQLHRNLQSMQSLRMSGKSTTKIGFHSTKPTDDLHLRSIFPVAWSRASSKQQICLGLEGGLFSLAAELSRLSFWLGGSWKSDILHKHDNRDGRLVSRQS